MTSNDIIFHVYEKRDNHCIFHNLTVEEVEDKLRTGDIQLGDHDIEPVEQRVYGESPSY